MERLTRKNTCKQDKVYTLSLHLGWHLENYKSDKQNCLYMLRIYRDMLKILISLLRKITVACMISRLRSNISIGWTLCITGWLVSILSRRAIITHGTTSMKCIISFTCWTSCGVCTCITSCGTLYWYKQEI